MANINAVNKALRASVPSQKVASGEYNAYSSFAYDEVTLAAELAVNDTITTGIKIPKGARIIAAGIKSPSLGATGILSLGTVVDGALLSTGDADSLLAIADAGGQAVVAGIDAASVDHLKEQTSDVVVYATCTEITAAGTGKKIQFWAEFAMV